MPSPLPQAVELAMAQRAMRMHHALWHTARNGWSTFPANVRQVFTNLGWKPPRPALDAAGNPILDNASGEDFLYMHRQMIGQVNKQLRQLHDPTYPKVEGWKSIPAPGDAAYPVPSPYSLGDPQGDAWLAQVKSPGYFASTILPQASKFDDPAYLRTISLGELGARVEFTVHNWCHMRFSAKPTAMRPDPSPTNPTAIATKWDKPSYDWLGDFYSSHVNSTFWKLHGWVDDRVGAWKTAHGVTGPIKWKGKWVGKMTMSGGMGGMHRHLAAAGTDASSPELDRHADVLDELLRAAVTAGPLATPALRVDVPD